MNEKSYEKLVNVNLKLWVLFFNFCKLNHIKVPQQQNGAESRIFKK